MRHDIFYQEKSVKQAPHSLQYAMTHDVWFHADKTKFQNKGVGGGEKGKGQYVQKRQMRQYVIDQCTSNVT